MWVTVRWSQILIIAPRSTYVTEAPIRLLSLYDVFTTTQPIPICRNDVCTLIKSHSTRLSFLSAFKITNPQMVASRLKTYSIPVGTAVIGLATWSLLLAVKLLSRVSILTHARQHTDARYWCQCQCQSSIYTAHHRECL